MNIGKIVREVEVLPADPIPDEAVPVETPPSSVPEPTPVPAGA